MKNLISLLLLFIVLGMCSCSGDVENIKKTESDDKDSDNKTHSALVFGPTISIRYIDKNNNNLLKSCIIDPSETLNLIQNKDIFEFVLFTDQNGTKYDMEKVILNTKDPVFYFSIEAFDLYSLKKVKIYTIKYKIPRLFGSEHIEEIIATYAVDGIKSGFISGVWYNNTKLKERDFENEDNIVYISQDDLYITIKVDK